MIGRRLLRTGERGFTIIELLIATAVLSTILLLATIIMVNISNLYYKGVNQSRIQSDVRNIAGDISDALKLTDAVPQPGSTTIGGIAVNAYCIGTTRYTYVLDTQLGNKQYYPTNPNSPPGPVFQHVLWRDTITTTAGCSPVDLTSPSPNSISQPGVNGAELIAARSRLTWFAITPPTSPYNLSIAVAYGDDDLLNHNGYDSTCKGGIADRFCSTARLTTTIVQRLTGSSS